MSSERRYRVTRLDGYADLEPRSADSDAPPGATFHVVDSVNGRVVAEHRSEDVAVGLPHHVRVNIAEWRANDAADRLERKAAELLTA